MGHLPPSIAAAIDRVRREYRAGELTYGDAVICICGVVNVTPDAAREILDHPDDVGSADADPAPMTIDWTGWIRAHRRAAQRRAGSTSSAAVMADPEYARAMDIATRAGIARITDAGRDLAAAEAEARAHQPEQS